MYIYNKTNKQTTKCGSRLKRRTDEPLPPAYLNTKMESLS